MEKPYRLPDPEKMPEAFLVILYKTLKKIEYSNREWDKIYFARCMKRTKQLLECMNGNVRKSAQCMRDLKDRFEGDGLSWTIETIIQYCFEWRADFDKISDRDCMRGLAAAYQGTGVENLLKAPEVPESRYMPQLAEPEVSEEDRAEALRKLAECKATLKEGAKEIPNGDQSGDAARVV